MTSVIGRQRTEATATAEGTSRSIDEALYRITHDLRGPIKALGVLPDFVAEDLAGEPISTRGEVAKHLDDMKVMARRLDRMLVDLLQFSRIGRRGGPETDIDLRTLIADKVSEAGIGDRFIVRLALTAPVIRAPRHDFAAMIAALIDNAARHHDRDHGVMSVTTDLVGEHVVIRVTDDGPGIEERFHEMIFDLMTTLRPRDECETSGVGLALARRVAENLSGSITVCSNDGQRGSTFEIALPVMRARKLADLPPRGPNDPRAT